MGNAIVERPILFSGPMVRAILEGRKTQTRRIAKQQPLGCYKNPYGKIGERLWVRETCWSDGQEVYYSADEAKGQWVPHRKRVKKGRDLSISRDESYQRLLTLHHYAGGFCRKVPAIHMPRWACRIVLEIENIRVERLHEITNADCVAEGQEPIGEEFHHQWGSVQVGKLNNKYSTVRQLFSELWTEINGANSWNENPWVWVIQFRKIEEK